MLATYLKTIPCTKFILFEDNVKQKSNDFIVYLLDTHKSFSRNLKLIYYEFEFNRSLNSHLENGIKKVDCIRDCDENEMFVENVECVIVIDSLAHAVHKFGLEKTYSLLHRAKKNKNVKQIVTTLHLDLFDEKDDGFKIFEYLSTLKVVLEPKFMEQSPRVSYTYKKPAGKVISDIEQYSFENGNLLTKPIEKLDPSMLIQESIVKPESLTTFKIGLDENDKQSKEKFTLPYLPKETEETAESEIFYEFDDVDDWDEEDPDDDLDI